MTQPHHGPTPPTTAGVPTGPTTEIERAVAQTLSDPWLGHDTAVATLAAAFDAASLADPRSLTAGVRELLNWFDDAARPLFGAAGAGLHDQAAALNDALVDHLPGVADAGDAEALLLGRALVRGAAHPLLLAIAGHELARRAGLHSVLAHGQGRDWTVLARDGLCLPVGYVAPPDGGLSVERLRGCCAHLAADRILVAIAGHGSPSMATMAARIRDAVAPSDCGS